MATAEEIINKLIQNSIDTANEQTAAATEAAEELIDAQAGIYIEPPDSSTGFGVTAQEPTIPTAEDTTIQYDIELDKILALLKAQLADFFATYYPLASDAFDEAQAWLVDTITNGGTGINESVLAQLWQRDRERIMAEGRRVLADIVTGQAAKGHFILQGAASYRQQQALYEQAGNLGTASTTAAVEEFRTEVETVKFAITQAIASRTMAMNAAADYIRAIATAPDSAARIANINVDNQARMVSAYSSWYGTRLERDRIILSSKLAEMQSRDDIYKHRRDNSVRAGQVDVQALTAAADVLARTASAALSSLNSVISNSVNAFA